MTSDERSSWIILLNCAAVYGISDMAGSHQAFSTPRSEHCSRSFPRAQSRITALRDRTVHQEHWGCKDWHHLPHLSPCNHSNPGLNLKDLEMWHGTCLTFNPFDDLSINNQPPQMRRLHSSWRDFTILPAVLLCLQGQQQAGVICWKISRNWMLTNLLVIFVFSLKFGFMHLVLFVYVWSFVIYLLTLVF